MPKWVPWSAMGVVIGLAFFAGGLKAGIITSVILGPCGLGVYLFMRATGRLSSRPRDRQQA